MCIPLVRNSQPRPQRILSLYEEGEKEVESFWGGDCEIVRVLALKLV